MAATSTVCQRCGVDFKYPSKLTRHLNRKTRCAPKSTDQGDSIVCADCNQTFSTPRAAKIHLTRFCNGFQTDQRFQSLLAKVTEMDQQIKRLEEDNEKLKKDNEQLIEHNKQLTKQLALPTTPTTQYIINNIHTTQINVFGSESISHVTISHIKRILDNAIKFPSLEAQADNAVINTAMLVYSDEEHVENITCYMTNKRADTACVRTETGWDVMPVDSISGPMITKSYDVIFEYQPHSTEYGDILRYLIDNENIRNLRPVLSRNKTILKRIYPKLPPPIKEKALALPNKEGHDRDQHLNSIDN